MDCIPRGDIINAYLNSLNGLPLQPKIEEYRILYSSQFHLRPEPLLEIERRDDGKKVHHDMVVDHVVGIRFKSFEVEWSEVDTQPCGTKAWEV